MSARNSRDAANSCFGVQSFPASKESEWYATSNFAGIAADHETGAFLDELIDVSLDGIARLRCPQRPQADHRGLDVHPRVEPFLRNWSLSADAGGQAGEEDGAQRNVRHSIILLAGEGLLAGAGQVFIGINLCIHSPYCIFDSTEAN